MERQSKREENGLFLKIASNAKNYRNKIKEYNFNDNIFWFLNISFIKKMKYSNFTKATH